MYRKYFKGTTSSIKHCIKNLSSSVTSINKYAWEYFGKPLSDATVLLLSQMLLKLYCTKKEIFPEQSRESLGSKASGMDHQTVEVFLEVN